jgi:hypothetical protein
MSVVDWVLVDKDAVSVGDTVSADAGGMPVYRVMGLANGVALLQDEQHADLRQAPLECFPWKKAALSRP